jgi:hypothetical protein
MNIAIPYCQVFILSAGEKNKHCNLCSLIREAKKEFLKSNFAVCQNDSPLKILTKKLVKVTKNK